MLVFILAKLAEFPLMRLLIVTSFLTVSLTAMAAQPGENVVYLDASIKHPKTLIPMSESMTADQAQKVQAIGIYNDTGEDIVEVSLGPDGAPDEDFSPDMLQDRKFPKDTQLAFAFLPASQKRCSWTLYIETAGGAHQSFRKVINACDYQNASLFRVSKDGEGYLIIESKKKPR